MVRKNNKRFWKGKRVLVTGHEGFLGSWLSKTLVLCGAKVMGIDKVRDRIYSIPKGYKKSMKCAKIDISDRRLVEKVIDGFSPAIIFHLAAEALVQEANLNPIRAFESNIQGTWNILEAARGKKFIEGIVVASSDKAYGSSDRLPYNENTALKGDHPYDVSKSCADLICKAYHNTYGLPVCVTRCGNIYGPGDFHFSRIVPDTIHCAITNKKIEIRSDGTFTRDYIYIEDVVTGYMVLAEKLKSMKLSGEAFNFSNELPVSVLELVKAIYKSAGKKPCYKILNSAKNEIKDQYLSAGKARKLLKWKPVYTLNDGIRITIDWYKRCVGCK